MAKKSFKIGVGLVDGPTDLLNLGTIYDPVFNSDVARSNGCELKLNPYVVHKFVSKDFMKICISKSFDLIYPVSFTIISREGARIAENSLVINTDWSESVLDRDHSVKPFLAAELDYSMPNIRVDDCVLYLTHCSQTPCTSNISIINDANVILNSKTGFDITLNYKGTEYSLQSGEGAPNCSLDIEQLVTICEKIKGEDFANNYNILRAYDSFENKKLLKDFMENNFDGWNTACVDKFIEDHLLEIYAQSSDSGDIHLVGEYIPDLELV